MSVRRPVVSGQFYPSSASQLRRDIEKYFSQNRDTLIEIDDKTRIYGGIVPHAGYDYSGLVASYTYKALSTRAKPDTVVLVGPNHWGIGSPLGVFPRGSWVTPLGIVKVDEESANRIKDLSKLIDLDFLSHSRDHSIECQLPFLQYIYSEGFKILPILISIQDQETACELGTVLADLATKLNIVLLASSDFTHYESQKEAVKKDSELIKAINSLDVDKYYSILEKLNVTACGYGAIAAIMVSVKKLGAKEGRLLNYATSGDVTNDKESVVGYSSIVFL